MSLKPAAIATADYEIARTPNLGGEWRVMATLQPCGVTKRSRYLGSGEYETYSYGTIGGVACTVVGQMGLNGKVSGIIYNPSWLPTYEQQDFFPTGKAGVGSLPAAWASDEANRGRELYEVEINDFNPGSDSDWFEIGACQDKSVTLPTRESKTIADGLISSAWSVPGKTSIGELTVNAFNLSHERGLRRIAGLKATIMLRLFRESTVETARIYLLNWTPTITENYPTQDGESTVSGKGNFSMFAAISADGQSQSS